MFRYKIWKFNQGKGGILYRKLYNPGCVLYHYNLNNQNYQDNIISIKNKQQA